MDPDTLLHRVRERLPALLAFYAFGSRIDGTAGPDSDLDLAFAMMEPRLARMLTWFGVNFTQIGEMVDYHGFRGPFLLRREQVLPDLKPDIREFFDLIMAQVVGGCGPAGVEEF